MGATGEQSGWQQQADGQGAHLPLGDRRQVKTGPHAQGDCEAGEHGHRASARRMVLTHYSDEMDPDWARAEAVRTYGGPVELAREGDIYTV